MTTKTITTFEEFNFAPEIAQAITEQGFTTPTPIQAQAIPLIRTGCDLVGLAQTGTGKTAAFGLPIIEKLLATPKTGNIRALILAPTRELAQQIDEVLKKLCSKTQLRSMAVYGGVPMFRQLENLRKRPDIVVACPGRLTDHMKRKTINLSQIEICVLDEADQMFDMGFIVHLRQIMKALPKQRQNLLFSATMPNEIQQLTKEILVNPKKIEINRTEALTTISHYLYPVAGGKKTQLLMHLLSSEKTESVLVFARTKHRTKRLAEQLEDAGHKVTSLQGNLSQGARTKAMKGFRTGEFQILVATDIAARGIDVSSVSHVVNYDVPQTSEAYTHRIGRTGRASRTGDALTFVSPEERSLIRYIERNLGYSIEQKVLQEFARETQEERKTDRSGGDRDRQQRFGGGAGGRGGARGGSRDGARGGFGGRSNDRSSSRSGARPGARPGSNPSMRDSAVRTSARSLDRFAGGRAEEQRGSSERDNRSERGFERQPERRGGNFAGGNQGNRHPSASAGGANANNRGKFERSRNDSYQQVGR